MGWFDNTATDYAPGRFRRSYDYVSGYAQESPTTFGCIMAIISLITAVLAKQASVGEVAGPLVLAIIPLFQNIHARKAHQEISDALEEVRAARNQVTYTRNDLRDNTEQTITAAESADRAAVHAEQAAAAVARVEELTKALNAKLDAIHAKVG